MPRKKKPNCKVYKIGDRMVFAFQPRTEYPTHVYLTKDIAMSGWIFEDGYLPNRRTRKLFYHFGDMAMWVRADSPAEVPSVFAARCIGVSRVQDSGSQQWQPSAWEMIKEEE